MRASLLHRNAYMKHLPFASVRATGPRPDDSECSASFGVQQERPSVIGVSK